MSHTSAAARAGILGLLALMSAKSQDHVNLSGTSGMENGILACVRSGSKTLVYKSFVSSATSIDVGPMTPASGNNEVVAFTNLRPVAIKPSVSWSPATPVSVPFAGPIVITVRVWIVKGPYQQQHDEAVNRCIATKGIWDSERMGVAMASCADIVDATTNPLASAYYSFDCTKRDKIRKDIGEMKDRVNVYIVDTVLALGSYGNGKGNSCGIGTNLVALGSAAGDDLLAHELGHSFGLTHIDDLTADFDDTNVMFSQSVNRQFLTEGQLFRAHLSSFSTLNSLYPARTGLLTRDCLRDVTSDTCPSIRKRIWADGNFPAN